MPKGIYQRTIEHRKNMSIAHKGKHYKGSFIKGQPSWIKGKHQSTQHIKRKRYAMLGKHWNVSILGRRHMREGQLKRIAEGRHNNWKGGITPINYKIRNSLEYKLWRQTVFERDRFSCVLCTYRSHKRIKGKSDIHADHIKPFCSFPELRFVLDNGRTLCIPCHRKTDTYGSKTIYSHG